MTGERGERPRRTAPPWVKLSGRHHKGRASYQVALLLSSKRAVP